MRGVLASRAASIERTVPSTRGFPRSKPAMRSLASAVMKRTSSPLMMHAASSTVTAGGMGAGGGLGAELVAAGGAAAASAMRSSFVGSLSHPRTAASAAPAPQISVTLAFVLANATRAFIWVHTPPSLPRAMVFSHNPTRSATLLSLHLASSGGHCRGAMVSSISDIPNLSGQVVGGKYRVDRLIGTGGMGTVWEGVHGALGHKVAIKFIKPAYASHPDARKRFEIEARAAAKLKTKHAVQVYDFGVTEDEIPYLVMEYLEGQSLSELL